MTEILPHFNSQLQNNNDNTSSKGFSINISPSIALTASGTACQWNLMVLLEYSCCSDSMKTKIPCWLTAAGQRKKVKGEMKLTHPNNKATKFENRTMTKKPRSFTNLIIKDIKGKTFTEETAIPMGYECYLI